MSDVYAKLTAGFGSAASKHTGTTDMELWFPTSGMTCASISTFTMVASVLRAMPFTVGRRLALDRVALEQTTAGAAGKLARMGIYACKSVGNRYPGALLWDSGSFAIDGANGAKAQTLALSLTPEMYWWVVVSDGTPVIRGAGTTGMECVLGYPSTIGTAPNAGLSVAFAYAALPATFPGAATVLTNASTPFPLGFYRASA